MELCKHNKAFPNNMGSRAEKMLANAYSDNSLMPGDAHMR